MAAGLLLLAASSTYSAPSCCAEQTSQQATTTKTSSSLVQLNLLISEPCSLMRFMDCISERHHTTSWVKTWYKKARGEKAAADKKFISDYQNLMQSTANKVYRDETGREQDLDQYILCLASQSKNIPDFVSKVKKELEEKQFEKLKAVIEHFSPIYHEMLWLPRLPELQKQLATAQESVVSTQLTERLQKVQHFMNANWPSGISCNVVLIPLPEFKLEHKNTSGENLGRIQIVEVLPGEKLKINLDVVFHECCHALWHTSRAQDSTNKEFQKHPNGFEAFSELNEGMATALGQGWFSKQAYGKVQKNWYVDEVVDKYAHALYPPITKYMNSDKVIDAEFARLATEIFSKKLKNTVNSRQLITAFDVYCDKLDSSAELRKSIQTAIPRLHSFSLSCPLDNPQSLEAYRNSASRLMAFLVPQDKVSSLRSWGFSATEIDNVISSKGLTVVQKGDRKILFCVAPTSQQQTELLVKALQKPDLQNNSIQK